MTIKETIFELDSIARGYDHYEYGLPTHEESLMNNMENEIRGLIEFHIEKALISASKTINYEHEDLYENEILISYSLENIK